MPSVRRAVRETSGTGSCSEQQRQRSKRVCADSALPQERVPPIARYHQLLNPLSAHKAVRRSTEAESHHVEEPLLPGNSVYILGWTPIFTAISVSYTHLRAHET